MMRTILFTVAALVIGCGDDGDVAPLPDAPPAPDAPVTADAPVDMAPTFTLTVTAGSGGTVTSSPAGISCTSAGGDCSETFAAGTIVTLTATGDTDFALAGWGGDCAASASSGPAGITIDADRACSATFVGTTGEITVIPPPASVIPNTTEDATNILMFLEQQGLVLGQALAFDIHVPDTYSTAPPTGGTVPAGTSTNIYFVHFDPTGTAVVSRSATLVFPDPIIAVITDNATLDATDLLVGLPTITYPAAGTHPDRGLELNLEDSFSISADRKTLVLNHSTSTSSDQLRVITTTGAADPPFLSTANLPLAPAPPVSVALGGSENTTQVLLFLEREVTLGAALDVDVTAPGTFTNTAGFGGTIAAGTKVESYLVHFDTVGGALGTQSVSASFTRPIVGLVLQTSTLDATDATLGAANTTYPAAGVETARGIDLTTTERVIFSADGKSVRFALSVTTGTDTARVIVQVP